MKGRDVERPLYECTKGVLVSLRVGLRLEGVCEEEHRVGGGGGRRGERKKAPNDNTIAIQIYSSHLAVCFRIVSLKETSG